jgi:hypothetical protein
MHKIYCILLCQNNIKNDIGGCMAKDKKKNDRIDALIRALKCLPNSRIYACEDSLNPSLIRFVLESVNGAEPSVNLGKIHRTTLDL